MADDDKEKSKNFLENGKFAPGNKITRAGGVPTAIRRMFRERRSFAMQLWEGFQLKTEDEIQAILDAPHIPIGNKIFGEFFLRLKKTASLNDLQLYFGMSGLKPEYVEHIFGKEDETDDKPDTLTKEEKLLMLDAIKEKVESED